MSSEICAPIDDFELTAFLRDASRRVRVALVRRGLRQVELEDCSQDVLIEVTERWAQLRDYPLAARYGYLYALCRGAAVALFRRSRYQRALFANGVTEDEPDPWSSSCAEAEYLRQRLRMTIETCLADCAPAARTTFELVCLGHSEAEVASLQGLPLGTVASRLRRIRSRLRKVLLEK
ncbi:MAG: sigma factor-like helix-turn-helix DNA-binding protein [Pseudomonadota bacterium]